MARRKGNGDEENSRSLVVTWNGMAVISIHYLRTLYLVHFCETTDDEN